MTWHKTRKNEAMNKLLHHCMECIKDSADAGNYQCYVGYCLGHDDDAEKVETILTNNGYDVSVKQSSRCICISWLNVDNN